MSRTISPNQTGERAMTFHKWMVGFGLAFLMIAVLVVNALLFSARSFQFNLASMGATPLGIVSVEAIADAETRLADIERQTAMPRAELVQIAEQLSTVDTQLAERQNQAVALRSSIAGTVTAIEAQANIASAEPAAALDEGQLAERVGLLANQRLGQEATAQVQTLRADVDRLNLTLDQIDEGDTQRRQLLQRQSLLGNQVADAQRQEFAIKQEVVSNIEQYDAVRTEAQALVSASVLGIGAGLVQAHPTMLSTGLVLLMGLLGAILYLFPAYMSRATPVTFAEIAVRSIFGMVTALAFYIVANASIAGLAFVPGGSAAESATAINPFTVSLIGIVAGIMADDIAKWIHKRGSELLGGAPGVSQVAPPPANAGLTGQTDAGYGGGVNPHGGPFDPNNP
jgi:hypothetical protein